MIILTGCESKSSFPLTFWEFSLTFYDNQKQYIDVSPSVDIAGIDIRTIKKEQTTKWETGFINSLVIIETNTETWTDIEALANANTKKLQLKLLNYTSISNSSKKLECDIIQYSWYMTTFSYQVDTGTIYGGQYFLSDQDTLYLVSLSSDEEKDIQKFAKSIDTIKCIIF